MLWPCGLGVWCRWRSVQWPWFWHCFAMIDKNWVLVQSSAVLVLKASRAAVLGLILFFTVMKQCWQACWPSNCYLDWKNEKGFIWSLLHYMAQERLMCFWGVVKPWFKTGKCVWNVLYKMSELVYEVQGHCVGGVSMVLLNHPIFLKARIWRLVERMFPCQHYEVLVCLLSMDCDREYLLGCSLWLSHGLSRLVWYQDTGGGVSMALLNHPIVFGLQLYWGWAVGCSMWLSHPKCFSLFGFFFLLRMGSKSSEVVVAWSVAKACLWRECFRAGTCGASVLTFQGRWAWCHLAFLLWVFAVWCCSILSIQRSKLTVSSICLRGVFWCSVLARANLWNVSREVWAWMTGPNIHGPSLGSYAWGIMFPSFWANIILP